MRLSRLAAITMGGKASEFMQTDPDLHRAVQYIDEHMEEYARAVIRSHLDFSRPENQSFLDHPDDRDQHQADWHQWGIVTHSRIFLQHYRQSIPALLNDWGIDSAVQRYLGVEVDGIQKSRLLEVSILLHDIGKFGARTRGRERFHFARHERASGRIIRDQIDLHALGFSDTQAEYIAQTAEDHFVLGLVRKSARDTHTFDDHYPLSEDFARRVHEVRAQHPDDYVEIGVLFLGDSLAKVDPATGPPRAVSQYDVNIAVAREYLRIVLSATL